MISFLSSVVAVFAAVTQLIAYGIVGVPAVQHTRNDEFPPTVYVGGLFVYGERDALNQRVPYPGIFWGDVPQMVRDAGFEFYTASPGPLSSNWDRAVTLFAELTGTRADYGIAHARAHNHPRFGRDFSGYGPLVEGWSPERPINFLGYSVGAPTIYLLAHLLAEGCADERAATPADELSPLFAGGNSDLVHSITSLAGTLNGTTVDAAIPNNDFNILHRTFYRAFFLVGRLGPINGVYNLRLERFGLSRDANYLFNPIWPWTERRFFNSRDHILYDLSLGASAAMNAWVRTQPDIYYFSHVLCAGEQDDETGHWMMGQDQRDSFILFYWLGNRIGRDVGGFEGSVIEYHCQITDETRTFTVDETWRRSDGAANFMSAQHPIGAPNQHFDRNNIRPGTWQVMPTLYGYNHGFFGGFDTNHDAYRLRDFLVEHIELLHSTWN